jgi:hypothetical protein
MLPISLRLSLVIALVVLLAVIVTSMLNVLKFDQVMEDFEDSRYTFVAHDIAHVLEQSLNLGLPLNQIDSAQQTLERQLDLDPGIASIAVFDTQGDILFQVGRLPPGRAEAVLFDDQIDGDLGAESFSSTRIENSFGQIAGGVIVRHSAAIGAQRDQIVLRVMSIAALVAALVGITVVWFGSSQLLRPLRRRLTRATISLRAVGSDETTPSLESISDEEHEFEALAGRVLQDLRRTERDVDAISPDGEASEVR